MQDEKIDVGDTDEQATEIDLDAPAPEQSLEEEIKVELPQEFRTLTSKDRPLISNPAFKLKLSLLITFILAVAIIHHNLVSL